MGLHRAIALETIKCNVKVSKNTSYLLDILIANHFQLNSKASGVELEKKILLLSDYFLNMLRHTVYRHSAKNKPKWIFSNAIALWGSGVFSMYRYIKLKIRGKARF